MKLYNYIAENMVFQQDKDIIIRGLDFNGSIDAILMNVVNNVETYRALAEVRGVLEELLTEMRIPYSIVLASSWKSKLGIKGANRTAQKQAAQKYVFEKHGIKAIQDICDAICIGDYHLANSDGFDWAD